MKKISELFKKYHILPYIISVMAILIISYGVKWFSYASVAAAYGPDAVYLYKYFRIIMLIILIGFSVVYFFTVIKKTSIEIRYAIICFFAGILAMLVITPYASADEERHIYECYDSAGFVLGDGIPEDGNTHYLRVDDANTQLTRSISAGNYIYTCKNMFTRVKDSSITMIEGEGYRYNDSAIIFYFPGVIGIVLGRLFGLGTVMTYMLARLLLLITYTVLTYFALKKIPVLKSILAIVMLMPTVIYRAATVSQDGLIYAYTFLFLAYTIYYVYNKSKIRIKDTVIMVLTGVGMALGKGGVYIPLMLLLFLIPKDNFGPKVKYGIVVACSALVCIGSYIISNPAILTDFLNSAKGTDTELMWIEDNSYSLKSIIKSPGGSLKLLVCTFFLNGGTYLSQAVGDGYGWIQINVSQLWTIAYVVIMAAALLNVNGTEYTFDMKKRTVTLVTGAISAFLTLLSMWIFWTRISSPVIEGVQGRYFVPVIFLILIAVKNKKCVINKNIVNILLLLVFTIHIATFFDIWLKIAI